MTSYHPKSRMPRKSLRHCVRSFTPAWFTVNMGTGTVSVLAARFYFGREGTLLLVISGSFFLLNLILYIFFVAITITRFCLYPRLLKKALFNTTESLFVGGFPIGTATLIDGALILHRTYRLGGARVMYFLWCCWWMNLFVAFTTAFGMIYVMMYTQNHMIKETTSLWVLPIIPMIVVSATGANLSQVMIEAKMITLATLTTTTSIISLSIGMSLTLMFTTLYLTRLVLHGPPKAQIVVSGFIITSPLGMGGFSLLTNGKTLTDAFPGLTFANDLVPDIEIAGQILYGLCFGGAFVLWSMGICWWLIAVFTIVLVRRQEPIPFTLTYWGAVFPNGAYALCTIQLGNATGSNFFHYLGVTWSCFVFFLWINAFIPTVIHTFDTSIFPESTPDQIKPPRIGQAIQHRTNSYHATDADLDSAAATV